MISMAMAILLYSHAFAAERDKNLHFIQLPFEGLSHHTVNCIFQDQTGFLWLGTINGLNRYDGNTYQTYQTIENNTRSISSNYINSIAEDKHQQLWVGTKYGLNRMVGGNFEHFFPEEGNQHTLPSPNVEVVYRDSKDRMWVGSWGGLSLYRESSNDFVNFTHDPQNPATLSGNVITTILEDSKGRFWIGTAFSGLNLLDPETGQVERFQKNINKDNCISGNSISAIYEDDSGQLWVGAERGGLNRFEEKTKTFRWYRNENKSTSLASNTVYSIIEDNNGALMVGGMNGGISIYNGREDNFFRFDTQGNYNPFGSKASVFAHYKLRTGEVVIATSNGGVKIQDNYPAAIEVYRHVKGSNSSLPMNNVSAMAVNTEGNVWLGTHGGGLCLMDIKTKKIKSFSGFKDKTINGLSYDPKHKKLWIATLENGLAEYNSANGKFTYYRHHTQDPHSIPSDLVRKVVQKAGGIWLGLDGGAAFFDPKSEKATHYDFSFLRKEKIPLGKVNSMMLDYTYKLWVASETGLHYFNEKSQRFEACLYEAVAAGETPRWVSYIHEDSQQHLWLNTLDEGLVMLDVNRKPVKFRVTNANDELKKITNIVEDKHGVFWITCQDGLYKCEVDHANQSIYIVNRFNTNDGLQGEVFNEQTAIYHNLSGEVLLGGLEGLNVFNPDRMNVNPNKPPVVLTGVKVNGKAMEMKQKPTGGEEPDITLSREDASLLDVSFSVLNYVKSQKNQYAYMLEGYDDTWRYVGNKGLASFANLPSGTYRLRVKGANNDGVWNREGLALTIRITPVIWETMIFKAAILLTIVSLLLLAFFLYRKLARRQGEQPSLADLVFNNHTEGESVILSKNSEDHALIERIVTYVESNMTNDDLSIEAMCTELGMSRAKLFRKVKEITGQTVSNFIKDIRLEKARLYLDANPRSVSEVAYTIGFKSHAHFTRSFKEKFGKSPSAYVQAQ